MSEKQRFKTVSVVLLDQATAHSTPVVRNRAADELSVSQSVFIITEQAPTRAFSWLKDTMLNGHLNMVSRCEIGRWRKYQN